MLAKDLNLEFEVFADSFLPVSPPLKHGHLLWRESVVGLYFQLSVLVLPAHAAKLYLINLLALNVSKMVYKSGAFQARGHHSSRHC